MFLEPGTKMGKPMSQSAIPCPTTLGVAWRGGYVSRPGAYYRPRDSKSSRGGRGDKLRTEEQTPWSGTGKAHRSG